MNNRAKSFLLAVLVISLPAILAGCGPLPPDREIVIKDIVQVSHHERDLYTFRIQEGSSPELERVTIYFKGKPREIMDVPLGQKMWVKYTARWEFGMNAPTKINGEIHFHSVKDIQGGGWDHGKHGRGTTTVLE